MKKLYPVILAFFASLGVYAQAPAPYPILVDSQRDTVAALQVFQANAITFRASFKSGGTANSIVAETPFMYWQPFGATNATVVTAQWSIVSAPSGIVDFAFTPASLNYAAGTYTYQIGLDQSGGPLVIKQGIFKINPSAASIGAEPIVFSTTNINWGSINWSGVPDWDLVTNVNTKLTTLSNNLQSAVDAINDGSTWSQFPATQTVDMAQQYATNLGGVDFDLTPSGSVAPGKLQWNPDFETLRLGLDANVSMDLGQQSMAYVRNAESVTISNGTVVYLSGATGDKATVKIASYSNDTLSARTIGIAAENIVAGGTGFVVTRGPVYAQNTAAFTEGAILYLGANGNLTTNRPQAPLHSVFIGIAEKINANAGVIYVAVQNGFELDELHDVNVSGVTSGQILKYNGTVWTNATEVDPVWAAASSLYYTASQADALFATGSPLYGVDLSPYATGTPIYSIDGLATGNPVYVESDPIWTSASSLYYTISAADAKFATGSPIYSVSGLATGTPLYSFTESDPVWTAASNIIDTRITANTTGKVALTTYLPATQALWAAIGNIVSTENALTNVTGDSRITATKTGNQVALTFNASGLATGTPIYSVAGLATGTPVYTESDPIWTSASSLYYTISAADAKFATGSPIYSISGLATGTPLYAESDPTAITNVTASGRLTATKTGKQVALTFDGTGLATGTPVYSLSGYLTSTDAAATYVQITNLPAGIVTTNNLTSIAGSGIDVTNNQLVVSSNDEVSFGTATVHKISAKSYSGGLSGTITNPSLTITAKDSVYGGFYSIHSGDIIIKPGDGKFSAVPFGGDVFISGGAGYTSADNGSVIVSNVLSIHFNDGTVISNFAASLSGFANNILTTNLLLGLPESSRTNISAGNVGAIQAGKGWTTNAINITGYSQHGIVENLGPAVGSGYIGFNAHGASQNGWIYGGNATIGDYAYGSMQRGYLRNSNAIATLNGAASIQLFYITNEATAFTTTNAYGSILLGPGTNNVAYSVKAAGGFYGNFIGNALSLTNFPSSLLTVSAGNTNYFRITTAPTSLNAYGISGQMAVGTNALFVYSPNALGSGTGQWLSVQSDGGATNIVAGSSNAYNASTRTITWNTNDVSSKYYSPYTVVNTNVGGTWTVDMDAAPVQEYIQTGPITSVVFNTSFTNAVIAPRVVLLVNTSSVPTNAWPSSNWAWSSGVAPTLITNKYNVFFFERSRHGKINAVYFGTEN